MQLTLADLKARIDRLDRLARGLAKEVRMRGGPRQRARSFLAFMALLALSPLAAAQGPGATPLPAPGPPGAPGRAEGHVAPTPGAGRDSASPNTPRRHGPSRRTPTRAATPRPPAHFLVAIRAAPGHNWPDVPAATGATASPAGTSHAGG